MRERSRLDGAPVPSRCGAARRLRGVLAVALLALVVASPLPAAGIPSDPPSNIA